MWFTLGQKAKAGMEDDKDFFTIEHLVGPEMDIQDNASMLYLIHMPDEYKNHVFEASLFKIWDDFEDFKYEREAKNRRGRYVS